LRTSCHTHPLGEPLAARTPWVTMSSEQRSPARLGLIPAESHTMLTFLGRGHSPHDSLTRRQFLQLGAMGAGGLTLADLPRLQAEGKVTQPAREKSVISVVLSGGPSHIDMYDLKPDAPTEYRGPFKPIRTRLPGVNICEHMPRQAQLFDRVALLRGVRSV